MDLGQVTLTQMRYALAVQDAGSFRVAAERSAVSQSGLSMQIKKLEELLGVVLFDRGRKPTLVTDTGRAALEQMRVILRETQCLGQLAREESEPSGPHRLGIIPTLSSTVVPLFLREFLRLHPRVELTIEELQTHVMMNRLRDDTLDAGIAAIPLDAPDLHEEVLGVEPFVAYLGEDDPLLGKRSVSQLDLATRELWVMPEGHCFRTQVLAYCDATANAQPTPARFESGSFETLMRLVDDGMGATVIPSLVAEGLDVERQAAHVRPFRAPAPVREIGLVTARTQFRRAKNEALASVLTKALRNAIGRQRRATVVLNPLA